MKTRDFELELKKIDTDFEIRTNPNSPEIAGVYWKGYCAYIGLPAEEIFAERNNNYLDAYGNPHRGYEEVISMAKGFLERIQNDPEYKDLITTNDLAEKISIPTQARKN